MRQSTKKLCCILFLAGLLLLLVVDAAGGSSNQLSVEKAGLIWEKTYGGSADDRAFSLTAVGDGYLVAGSSQSVVAGRTVGWILRLDHDGNVVWNHTYPAEGDGEIRQALSLNDGFLLVGNVFLPTGDIDGYVARINLYGNVMWNLTLGGEKVDKLFSAVSTSDGFVLAGLTYSFGGGNSDVWLVKVSLSGQVVWDKTFGGAADEAARAVTVTADGYAVAGYTNANESQDYDFLLLKLDDSGNALWNRTYGGTQSDMAYAMTENQGKLVVAGDTHSKGAGDSDAWIVEVDSDGNLVWDQTVGGADFDMPSCIVTSRFGGYLVGGFTFSFGSGKRDFWLFKLDDSGNVQWSCTQGKAMYEEAYAVVEDSQNVFVIAGWQNYAEGGPYDFYVVKITPGSSSDGFSAFPLEVLLVIVAAVVFAAVVLVYKLRKRRV